MRDPALVEPVEVLGIALLVMSGMLFYNAVQSVVFRRGIWRAFRELARRYGLEIGTARLGSSLLPEVRGHIRNRPFYMGGYKSDGFLLSVAHGLAVDSTIRFEPRTGYVGEHGRRETHVIMTRPGEIEAKKSSGPFGDAESARLLRLHKRVRYWKGTLELDRINLFIFPAAEGVARVDEEIQSLLDLLEEWESGASPRQTDPAPSIVVPRIRGLTFRSVDTTIGLFLVGVFGLLVFLQVRESTPLHGIASWSLPLAILMAAGSVLMTSLLGRARSA